MTKSSVGFTCHGSAVVIDKLVNDEIRRVK